MLDGIHKIHLIGIGGSGMRAIANILIQKGYDVSGSDVADSAVIEKFRNMGATVHIGHNKDYVKCFLRGQNPGTPGLQGSAQCG